MADRTHLDPDLAPGPQRQVPDDPGQQGEEGEGGEGPDHGQAPGPGQRLRPLGLDGQHVQHPAQAGLKWKHGEGWMKEMEILPLTLIMIGTTVTRMTLR